MRDRRLIALWAAAILALFIVEIAELTHVFRVPILSAVGNLVSFIFALVFTTILALVGALFIGIYISQRMQSGGGFTEFEEEMLRMRGEVQRMAKDLEELKGGLLPEKGSAPVDGTTRGADPPGTRRPP